MQYTRDDIYHINYSNYNGSIFQLSTAIKSIIITRLLLYRQLDVSKCSKDLNITENDLKEFIQLLIKAMVLRGFYEGKMFIVGSIMKHPIIHSKNTSDEEKTILGFFVANKKHLLTDLVNVLDISKEKMNIILQKLICNGLFIGRLSENILLMDWVWDPKTRLAVSDDDLFIVGVSMMLRETDLHEIAKYTKIQSDVILMKLSHLILHRQLESEVKLEARFFRKSTVHFTILRFLIKPKKLELDKLTRENKLLIGYLVIKRKVKLNELSFFLNLSPNYTLKILSRYTAQGSFQCVFNEKEEIVPLHIPTFTPTKTIDEIGTLSMINYQAIMGVLYTTHSIKLSKLAMVVNNTPSEVVEALIDLHFEGFITCYLDGKKVIVEEVKRYTKGTEGSLERWEKLILGMVIANKKISAKDVTEALGIDSFFAKEKMYSFLGKDIIKGRVEGDKLIPTDIPSIPILNQLTDFPIYYQEIFGFLISNKKVPIIKIEHIWNKSRKAVKNIIYELTGAGLITTELSLFRVKVLHQYNFKPNRELRDLGNYYLNIVNEIEKRGNKIKIKHISDTLGITRSTVFKIICQLLAFGYYKGEISLRVFKKDGDLILPAKKHKCLFCGHPLEQLGVMCPNCSKQPPICTVCNGIIKKNQKVYKCPNCDNLSHKGHLLQWLQIKEECPVCKQKINEELLVEKIA